MFRDADGNTTAFQKLEVLDIIDEIKILDIFSKNIVFKFLLHNLF